MGSRMDAKQLKIQLNRWINRLAYAGAVSSDTVEQSLQKAILILLASAYCIAGTLWGIAYLALGLPFSASIPLCYAVVSGCSLVYFFLTKRYAFFRFSQLSLILILPFLLQFSLGGFAASSAVVMWSVLSPIGALMFAGTRQALPWFVAYLLLMSIAGVLDGRLARHAATIPPLFAVIFFVMNLGGVSTIVYMLLRYFVSEREHAMAVLDKKHRWAVKEKERLKRVKAVLANFVPEAAKDIIEKDQEKGLLNKSMQHASVLFLDIEGFTRLLQKYPMEKINRVIETYFSIFFHIVQRNEGDINELAGDGMMAIFHHLDSARHARNAVQAALEIQEQCFQIPKSGEADLFPIKLNMGISSGEVSLGSTKMRGPGGARWVFNATGPVTVLAARLSEYADAGQILIGAQTARLVGKQFPVTHLGEVRLKNFKNAVDLYQIPYFDSRLQSPLIETRAPEPS